LCDLSPNLVQVLIEDLRTEAWEAGDVETVDLCILSQGGDEDAIEQCLKIIADARRMG